MGRVTVHFIFVKKDNSLIVRRQPWMSVG